MYDERFARQYLYEPPPEFPLASPCPGIVHHLSGPNRYARTQTFHRRSWLVDGALALPPVRFLAPHGFITHRLAYMLDSLVRVSRRVDWSHSANVLSAQVPKPETRACSLSRPAGIRFVPPGQPTLTRAPRWEPRPEGRGQNRGPPAASNRFPLNNFKHFLTLFSKFFSSFPHGTCSLSVSRQYLALDGIYHRLWAAIPNNPTPRTRLVMQPAPRVRGCHPLRHPVPGDLGVDGHRGRVSRLQFGAQAPRFSSWALPGSLAVTRGILVSFFSSA